MTWSMTFVIVFLGFVGLVGRQDHDTYWVIDPSLSTCALTVSGQTVSQSFTGEALLLKGNSVRPGHSQWLSFPSVIAPAVLVSLVGSAVVRSWRRSRHKIDSSEGR